MSTATPTLAPEPLSLSAVLRIPVMRRLFYAQVVSVFGDFLALFAVINFLTFHLNMRRPRRSPTSRSPTCCPLPSSASLPASSSIAGR